MLADLFEIITNHSPVVGFVSALLIGVFLLARYLQAAEMRDMRRRIDYLDDQIRALRYRDECYFAYILEDQEYHNRVELIALQAGYRLEKHPSFLVFRDGWMKDRDLKDEEEEIWK